MAVGTLVRSHRQRQLIAQHEFRYKIANFMMRAPVDDILVRRYLLKETMLMLNPRASAARLPSVCVLTGRTAGVYRDFKLNRMVIRKEAWRGNITGMRKSTW